jgi:hypothetical protein
MNAFRTFLDRAVPRRRARRVATMATMATTGTTSRPPPPPIRAPILAPVPPLPPPNECCVCGEEAGDLTVLMSPCRSCNTTYCRDCLTDMFVGATNDATRFPPKCCNLVQIHTATGLRDDEAAEYRAKLEEYLTVDKVYCPRPTCSAFIPEKHLPPVSEPRKVTTLQDVLSDIAQKVTKDPAARFFRGPPPDITMQRGIAEVRQHIDLQQIQEKIQKAGYTTLHQLTQDIFLLVDNAKFYYHAPEHPVARAADLLQERYMQEISGSWELLLEAANVTPAPQMFACPQCHIGICTRCKQVAHGATACDTSAKDHELAMLEQFGYKRCPSCKHAVRKMYGCSHMQCVCGAHWCYWCQRAISECDGGCEDYRDSEEEDEEDFDSDVDVAEDELDGDDTTAQGGAEAQPVTNDSTGTSPREESGSIVNLDAGGSRRWAEAGLNFGQEPEDEGAYVQPWGCQHEFEPYFQADDGRHHGDINKMECNRCFEHVSPAPSTPPKTPSQALSRKRKSMKSRGSGVAFGDKITTGTDEEMGKQAWECCNCKLVCCQPCGEKYYGKDAGLWEV